MKKQLFMLPWLLLSLLLGACGDDEEGKATINDSAPAQVTNVTTASIAGGVTISWENPTSGSYMYTKITYMNAKGEETYQLYSKEHADESGKMTTTINGFVKTEPVTFKLFACSVRGNNSGAVEVQGTPAEPNFIKSLNKITVDPSLGGINVGYVNDYDESFYIVVDYKAVSDASKAGSYKFEVSPKAQGGKFVQLTYGDSKVLAGEECVINVHTEDAYDNASDSREFKVTPQETKLLDRSGWTVPGFNNNSSDATIGYDSQESSGEGATNGRVTCMFDGNTGTFWHTRWKGATPDYPHWFIVDMGEDHTIASIEITGRINNANEQKGEQILVCSDADAVVKSNPDSWNWQDMGEFSFDPKNDKPQMVDLTSKLPKARYIKVYIDKKFKGAGNFAMISEFNVYAAE